MLHHFIFYVQVLRDVVQMPLIVQECEVILRSKLQRLPPGVAKLPRDEALAVVSYSYDLGDHSTLDNSDDNLYKALNNALRERNVTAVQKLKPFLAYLMGGISRLPLYAGEVQRGVPGTKENLLMVRQHYLQGMGIFWNAFTSTSTSAVKAKSFAGGCGGIIFRIKVVNGRSIAAYSAIPDENEILLSLNTEFVVTGECTLDRTDGYYYVDMIERRQDSFQF